MQNRYIEIPMDDKSRLYIETVSSSLSPKEKSLWEQAAYSDSPIQKPESFFLERIEQIKKFATQISDTIGSIEKANEVEVEFSVGFSADAGIVISKIGSEASLTVKLKWSK